MLTVFDLLLREHVDPTLHSDTAFSIELEDYQGCFYEDGSEEACKKEADVSMLLQFIISNGLSA